MARTALRFLADENGATAIEYALIASLVSIAIVGILTVLNQDVTNMFNMIGENLNPALGGGG